MEIFFSNGYSFNDPEERIRKYCSIEIFHGYDDKHNINNKLEWEDIHAADKLYANIMRFGPSSAERLVCSKRIQTLLSEIDNVELGELEGEEWRKTRKKIINLIQACMQIHGIGIAKATKILHLKRPKLFPILDSYVMRFLLDIKIENLQKYKILDYTRSAFERVRADLINNNEAFNELEKRLYDLPTKLEKVRIHDILCWTIEKWDIREETSAPYGPV